MDDPRFADFERRIAELEALLEKYHAGELERRRKPEKAGKDSK